MSLFVFSFMEYMNMNANDEYERESKYRERKKWLQWLNRGWYDEIKNNKLFVRHCSI